MNKNQTEILIVVGTYTKEGGKVSFFGAEIIAVFNDYFGSENVKYLNGGTFELLEGIINELEKYRIILWMANVANSYKKLLPEIKKTNRTCFLIQSKRLIEKEYHVFGVVSRLLKAHANLGLMITKESGKYKFNVIDPLGNSWIETDYIKEAASKMAFVSDSVSKLNRLASNNVGDKDDFHLHEGFIKTVKQYGEKFSKLIKAIHPERFLGNASTRCMHGFPSIKLGEYYYISQRNVDKTIIDSSKFVKIEKNENAVKYYGKNKPSVDAPVQIKLYNFYSKVNYIIHGHVFVEGAPTTKKHIPCGFIEEFEEIKQIYPDKKTSNFSINLLGHGCIILAKDLSYFQEIKLIARDFPDRSCEI